MKRSIVIDDSVLKKRFTKAKKKWNNAASQTALELARLGTAYAKMRSPKDSGMTMSMIRSYKGQGRHEASIVAHNSTPGRADGFNLPLWMHTSPRAKEHIKSGSPIFMFDTKRYLNTQKKGVATTNIKQNKV